jgi:hypothetical protein
MINFDIKKILGETPNTPFEAIDLMVKKTQQLIDSLHIMESIIENPNEMEFHNKRIIEFLKQFENETNTAG